MMFVILFEDAAGADPMLRQTHMAAHLAFLEENAAQITAAGPLTDPDGAGRDGLWIVDVDTREAAERLVFADPFWPTGLRGSYAIIPWRRVFASGVRLIAP